MNEQETREALAEALIVWWAETGHVDVEEVRAVNDGAAESYADALMPAVRGIVARELREVADGIRVRFGWAGGYGKELRDRADGLEANP